MTRFTTALAAIGLAATPAVAGTVDADLEAAIAGAAPGEIVSAILHLHGAADIEGLDAELDAARESRLVRHREVVLALREAAAQSHPRILPDLRAAMLGRDAGEGLVRVDPFWIVNAVRVDGSPAAVAAAAGHPEVQIAYLNYELELIAPVAEGPVERPDAGGAVAGGAIEPGVVAVRAPELWAEGIDGTGILVATMDTGADGNHPAIASRWAGLRPEYAGNPQWAWLDPFTGDNSFPFDGNASSHGSHVTGTVVGGLPGDQIGVAPGAHWIAAGAIDRGGSLEDTVTDAITAFQWFLDPDGDAGTVFDVPHVVSNSWGLADFHGYPDCDETFWSFMDNLEAAGTIVLFAAGNEGTGGLRRPADRAIDDFRTLAVAAVDAAVAGFPIASFSSVGPTACTPDGTQAIKPDIAAPGVNVRSAISGGGYGTKSGTSMAAPHVNGVAALVRQVNPDLSVEEVKAILFQSATDLGSPGEDNTYGHGLIDAVTAVEIAQETVALSFLIENTPVLIDPDGGTTARVTVSGQAADPLPGSGLLHWREGGGPWFSIPMIEVEPNVYDAVFPSVPCALEIDWYVSAQNIEGGTATKPFQAPDEFFSTLAYDGEVISLDEDFETEDPFWMVVNVALDDGQWDRGVPAGDGDRGDPTADWDGSGSCWLTDNTAGNSDVDGGPTQLVSPAMDLSALPDPLLTYARWFSNDDADADALTVEISGDDGLNWETIETVTGTTGWVRITHRVLDHIGGPLTMVRLRFSATDNPNDSVTEAAIDAVLIASYVCDPTGDPADIDGDGSVGFSDLVLVLASFGPCPGCPEDIDGSGTVDFDDLLILLAAYGV